MRGVPDPELRAKCVKLRVDGRMSLREIHEATGAPNGSLSTWLREYPLTEAEKKARRRFPVPPKKDRGTESFLHQLASAPLSKPAKAQVAEAAVLLRLSLLSVRVFGSPFDGDKTDWVAIPPGATYPIKIQVKWAQSGKHGLPFVSVRCAKGRSNTGRYQDGDLDFLVGYDLFSDRAYVWSWGEVKGVASALSTCPEAEERWDKILSV